MPLNAKSLIDDRIQYFEKENRTKTERGEKLYAIEVLTTIENELLNNPIDDETVHNLFDEINLLTKFNNDDQNKIFKSIVNKIQLFGPLVENSDVLSSVRKRLGNYKDELKNSVLNRRFQLQNFETFELNTEMIKQLDELKNAFTKFTSPENLDRQIFTTEHIVSLQAMIDYAKHQKYYSTIRLDRLEDRLSLLAELELKLTEMNKKNGIV